jgi:nucleoside-diphosphate-sugar epimerase
MTRNAFAITGASGYVGGTIKAYFKRHGWPVYELVHNAGRRGRDRQEPAVPYSLGGELDTRVRSALENCKLLIHCAYDFSLVDWQSIRKVNIDGAIRLLSGAGEAGVERVVVISTMSAFDGCKSLYGRAKLAIEQEAEKTRSVVVRPGLVFGRSPGGVIGALAKIVSLSRIVPLIGGGHQVLHLAHEDDLCRLIFRIAAEKPEATSKPIIGACENGKTLSRVLEVLASAKGREVKFVPVSWRLVAAALRIAETMGLRVGLRSDSVVSLMNLDPNPDFGPTRQLGVKFREFEREALIS